MRRMVWTRRVWGGGVDNQSLTPGSATTSLRGDHCVPTSQQNLHTLGEIIAAPCPRTSQKVGEEGVDLSWRGSRRMRVWCRGGQGTASLPPRLCTRNEWHEQLVCMHGGILAAPAPRRGHAKGGRRVRSSCGVRAPQFDRATTRDRSNPRKHPLGPKPHAAQMQKPAVVSADGKHGLLSRAGRAGRAGPRRMFPTASTLWPSKPHANGVALRERMDSSVQLNGTSQNGR